MTRTSIWVKKPVKMIETADEARRWAQRWQDWQSEQALSIGELADFQNYFEALAAKFPELTDEFKENAII